MQAISQTELEGAVHAVRKAWPDAAPKLGIILGSGWGGAVSGLPVRALLPYGEIPGLGTPGVSGHEGLLLRAEVCGAEIFVFQGRRHVYEGVGWGPVVLPVWILKQFGARAVLLTNASGGIRDDLSPGTLMVMDDHIQLLGGNPLCGPYNPAFGERFPDQSAVYDPALRRKLAAAGADASGVYIAVPGPSFETPAEIRAFRAMGADAVGMSTVPEAVFANALGMKVAALSCVCNRAAGLGPGRLSGEDVIRVAHEAMPRMRAVLARFLENFFEEESG